VAGIIDVVERGVLFCIRGGRGRLMNNWQDCAAGELIPRGLANNFWVYE